MGVWSTAGIGERTEVYDTRRELFGVRLGFIKTRWMDNWRADNGWRRSNSYWPETLSVKRGPKAKPERRIRHEPMV